jgi:hypothetical protein
MGRVILKSLDRSLVAISIFNYPTLEPLSPEKPPPAVPFVVTPRHPQIYFFYKLRQARPFPTIIGNPLLRENIFFSINPLIARDNIFICKIST